MKKIIAFLLCVFIFCISISAQTINPSCFSNAKGWKVTRVENTSTSTLVYLEFYTYKENYKFFIHPGMYIEQYDKYGSARYYIKSFDDNELNKFYVATPFTTYRFVLRFQRIPDYWTDITIAEPATAGYNAFYWKYISLNKPASERLKADNFVIYNVVDFCKTFAHPTNTLKKYTYSVDKNSINLTLYYEQGYYTDLQFTLDGKLITNVSVIDDNDFVPPFFLLDLLKSWIMKNDSNGEYTSRLEREFNKALREMTSTELVCIILTVLWNSGK